PDWLRDDARRWPSNDHRGGRLAQRESSQGAAPGVWHQLMKADGRGGVFFPWTGPFHGAEMSGLRGETTNAFPRDTADGPADLSAAGIGKTGRTPLIAASRLLADLRRNRPGDDERYRNAGAHCGHRPTSTRECRPGDTGRATLRCPCAPRLG